MKGDSIPFFKWPPISARRGGSLSKKRVAGEIERDIGGHDNPALNGIRIKNWAWGRKTSPAVPT